MVVALVALLMLMVMTVVNTTVVVAELPGELVAFTASRGAFEPRTRVPKPLTVESGGSRSWLQVRVGDDLLWVSRPAFGGIVEHLAATADTPGSD